MAVGVILILCVSGLMAIFVAVHENMKTRRALRRGQRRHRRRRPSEATGGYSDRDDEYTIFDEYTAAAAESMRKMSQLPSYDEAIALPKPPAVTAAAATAAAEAHRTKRHSCTQTDDELDRDVAAVMGGHAPQDETYDDADVAVGGGYGERAGYRVTTIAEADDRFNNSVSSPPRLHVTRL